MLLVACSTEHLEVVKLLLDDNRVDINTPDGHGCTALWDASSNGYIDAIKWMIASGRKEDRSKKEREKLGCQRTHFH